MDPQVSQPTQALIAAMIDHTQLNLLAEEEAIVAIRQLCHEAVQYGFYSVCVRPEHIAMAKEVLGDSPVKLATVIGFPKKLVEKTAEQQTPTIGNPSTIEKLAEIGTCLAQGVDELDVVLNVGCFQREAQTGEFLQTLAELEKIYQAAQGCPIKLIIETDLLTETEIVQATRLCHDAKMSMVKTCTGFVHGGLGATVPIVTLIRETLQGLESPLGIKASGGIRSAEKALQLLQAGATRLGASAGVQILQELQ